MPDGSITQPDRQTVPFMYSGILATESGAVPEVGVGGIPINKTDTDGWRLAYVRHRRRRLTLPRGV